MNWFEHAASEHPNCDYSCCKAFLHPAAFKDQKNLSLRIFHSVSSKNNKSCVSDLQRPQPWELGRSRKRSSSHNVRCLFITGPTFLMVNNFLDGLLVSLEISKKWSRCSSVTLTCVPLTEGALTKLDNLAKPYLLSFSVLPLFCILNTHPQSFPIKSVSSILKN
jgi:hypothetical protein